MLPGQQEHLSIINRVTPVQDEEAKVYIDDGLGSGLNQPLLTQFTKQVTQVLQEEGFPISEKSHLEAEESQKYIGKEYSSGCIKNTDERCAKLLLLFAITSCAPYLSRTFLERILGVSVYAVCHTNGYSHSAYLRWLLNQRRNYYQPTPQLRNTLAAVWATSLTPWTCQGFFAMSVPNTPRIYVDAGPCYIGLVFMLHGEWMSLSIPLPDRHLKGDIQIRQQRSELWGVVQATKAALKYGLTTPTLILDATSAYGSTLKGSTGADNWDRVQILQELNIICTRYQFRAYLNLINTQYHPADHPSRVYQPLAPAPNPVMHLLQHIAVHPALVATNPAPYRPDLSRQAWATPDWMRWYILKTHHPPTVDLFADQSNALTTKYFSLQNPFRSDVLDSNQICLFQPPYADLLLHWQACLPHLPTTVGFWGLVPKNFFLEEVKPSLKNAHLCTWSGQVNYRHHTFTGKRAAFKTTCCSSSHHLTDCTTHVTASISHVTKHFTHLHCQSESGPHNLLPIYSENVCSSTSSMCW